MTGMAAILAQMLPADAPAEVRDAVAANGDVVPMEWLGGLLTDATQAKALFDAGDRDGALAILSTWRDRAEQLGVLPIYEQMIGPLVGPEA